MKTHGLLILALLLTSLSVQAAPTVVCASKDNKAQIRCEKGMLSWMPVVGGADCSLYLNGSNKTSPGIAGSLRRIQPKYLEKACIRLMLLDVATAASIESAFFIGFRGDSGCEPCDKEFEAANTQAISQLSEDLAPIVKRFL